MSEIRDKQVVRHHKMICADCKRLGYTFYRNSALSVESLYLDMAVRIFLVIIFSFIMNRTGAQENPAMNHRFHLQFSGNVPHPVSNKAFRRSFIGVYDLGMTFRIRLFSGFSAGINVMHSLWRIPDNKIPGLHTVGQFNGGGITLAYDYPVGEVAVLYAAINAGIAQVHYYGLSYDSVPDNFQTRYMINYGEFEVGSYFYTEGNFAIGIQTSFIFTNYDFDPYRLSLNEHKTYIPSDLEGNVVTFNFGFSVLYSFLKKTGG